MKQLACMLAAVTAWAALHAADSTNAPPREAAAPDGGVLASDPKDSAAEVLGLRRIRDTLARRPADDGGDAVRDWLTEVVVRCEQFLGDQPHSAHASEVRAVNAQCRLELSGLTGDRTERDKALQLAKQALTKTDRGPGIARARFVLARAAWPEDLLTVIDQTKLIARDYPDQPPADQALWLLARAQQRKGDERGVRESVIALFGSFPKSVEAAQARMLLRQLGLAAQPAPSMILKTADGKSIDLDTLRGQAVLLDFWTVATLPASEESGLVRRLFENHHTGGLAIIGVNLDADRATFDAANAAHPTPWPQVFANDPANGKLLEAYPALTAPSRLLLDPFGVVSRIAAHPAEIEPLMKRWQITSAVASSGAAKPPAVAARKETPKVAAAKTSEPVPKTRPPVEKRMVASAKPAPKPAPKPAVAAPAEKQVSAPPPPPPAPQPTHIEIGGVLYAKPLTPATNAIPVETTKPTVRVTSPVPMAPAKPLSPMTKPFATTEKLAKLTPAPSTTPSEPATPTAARVSPSVKPFADEEKPLKSNRPTVMDAAKAETPAAPPSPATRTASAAPLKSHTAAAATKSQAADEEKTSTPPSPATRTASTAPLKSHTAAGTKSRATDEEKPAKAESQATPPAPATRTASAAPLKSHTAASAAPKPQAADEEKPATPPSPATRTASAAPLKSHTAAGTKSRAADEEKPAKAESQATRTASATPSKSHTSTSAAKTRSDDEEKPVKASRPAPKETAKTEGPTAHAASSTPVKSHSGYSSSGSKTKFKENESLATMPDISEADRKAALMDAAKRILKSEEELITWSELESFFTTKKPASVEGGLAWYQDVADRCQQFIKDYPTSPHVNLVRINEARCRLAVFKATQDATQRVRAEIAAHEVLAHKPNEDDAIRAEFLMLNATWPDHPEQGVAIAKRIVKDFPHRPETAAAILMQAQFRRRQGLLSAAKDAASDLIKLYPESGFAMNARCLIKQCDLLNNPCPPVKLTGLHGEKMDTAACKGKPLLIEFWSANSRTAMEDAAKLVQLYIRYQPKGFEIYTICVDKSREAMDIFQLQHPLPWPVYWDGMGLQGPVCQQFGVDNAGMRFLLEPGLQRVVSTHLSPEGAAAALMLWIDRDQPPPLPGQEPPAQGFFQKFFGLKF